MKASPASTIPSRSPPTRNGLRRAAAVGVACRSSRRRQSFRETLGWRLSGYEGTTPVLVRRSPAMLRGACGWSVPAFVQPDPTRLGREGRRPPAIAWMRGFAHPHCHRPGRDDAARARAAACSGRRSPPRSPARTGRLGGAALDHASAHAAGLDDDVHGRGRRPARHLGFPRARRERLRPAPRQRLLSPRARRLAAPERRRAPRRRDQRAVHVAGGRRQRLRARRLRRVRPARRLCDADGPARGARAALRPPRAGSRVPRHARRRHRSRFRCGASPSSASS